jgi:type I restriction enzyme S subunit
MNNSYKYIYTAENYVDDNDLVKLKARPYPPNTIIFPKIGMAVRLNKYRILRLEALFDNNIAGVIINDKLAYYEFIYYYLQGKIDLMSLASMTTVPSITKTKLENIPIPYPSIHEQRRIAEILSTVDRVIEVVDAGVVRLEGLKKALMRELLTGRIRVREENGKLVFNKETDFQETEIGKIPREWKIVYLGELFEFQRGLSYRKNDLSSTRTSIRFVTINDLEKEGGWKHNGEPVYLSDGFKGKIEKKHVVDAGDLLIAITDMSKGFIIGAPLYINEDLRSQGEILVYSMDLVKLQPKRQVNALFYYYQLSWSEVRKRMKSLARGTNVLHLDLNSAKRIKLVEPPLDEQQRIAEILSTVDRVIESVDVAIARLEGLKRALMRELLTGRIRVREENGKLVFYRETEFQDTEIGKIPREWSLAKLEEMAKIITGPFGSQLKKSELTNHGIKVYMQENVLERNFEIGNLYISEEKFKELKNFEVMPDDVLLTIRGTIGKSIKVPTGIAKGIIHTNLAIIRLEKKEVLPDFVELVFNESEILMKQVRRIHSATTLPALYGRTLKQIKIMLPPLNEQKVVIGISSIIDRAIGLYRGERASLDRLKCGLMNLLLTGKIRVGED